jgi:hypothetical protein
MSGSASVLTDPEYGGRHCNQNHGDGGESIQSTVMIATRVSIVILHGKFLLLFELE